MDEKHFNIDRESLERDCEVEFIKAGGPGGQHRNKRETGVRLHHPPSGLTVMAVERRSQARNLDEAFKRMAEKLNVLNQVAKKRKPTRPTKGSVEKRLEVKRIHAKKKALRRVTSDEE